MTKNRTALIVGIIVLLFISISGCFAPYIAPPPPNPTGSFSVTEWTQRYSDYSEEYSSYVYVYFNVTNTGSCDIDYYKVWFEVTCADGSKFQDWTNGSGVTPGAYISDMTMINVAKKQAVSVAVTNYELTTYDW